MTARLLNQRIIANAGSGKTWRLTTRFIELMARGVTPERIVALTFTRKAAGEFLDAIFRRLLDALEDPRKAGQLAREIGFPDLQAGDFDRFLRLLIDQMPRLTLSTLDGFFGRIVRVFPFECGLAGEISILDPELQHATRRSVLGAVFRSENSNEQTFRELLELLRQQNRNREARSVVDVLDREVNALHERFLTTPRGRTWGDTAAIWADGPPFRSSDQFPQYLADFEAQLFSRHDAMEEKYLEGWRKRLDGLLKLRAGHDVPGDLLSFAVKALDPATSRTAGCFDLKIGNKIFPLPDSMRMLVRAIAEHVLALDLAGRAERSRALYRLLAKFEQAYHSTVRREGQLTFLDITGLLSASGKLWSGDTLRTFARQQIDYRLDASYDHWLLDEFQDTSRLQWQAIEGLVDEVIQGAEGDRSFFYVGDTKQAIYSWRGGDPALFDEIAAYYNSAGEERIDTSESLSTSYRSVPEVLEIVNMLFGPDNLLASSEALEFPDETLARWRSAWREHHPVDPARGGGCVSWQRFAVGRGEAVEVLDEAAASLVEDIDPLGRGWTCAVLVERNARVRSVVQALRARHIPAAAEGRYFPGTDNELGTGLLALWRWIAHPDDTLSHAHVGMTPLKALIAENGELFRECALETLRERGFAGTLAQWLAQLTLTPFLRNRAGHILEAATEFDAARGRSSVIDEFIDYAEAYSAVELADSRAIRVMTIHAAKGLDFDMLILPELEGTSLVSRRDDASIHLHRGPGGVVQWGFEMPAKELCRADPVLNEAFEADLAEDSYENLCRYYVALTRAKRGLYLLSTRQEEKSKSHDFNRLLHLTLEAGDDGFSLGNPGWYFESGAGEPETPEPVPPFPPSEKVIPIARMAAPSRKAQWALPARRYFETQPAAEKGRDLHAALAAVLPGADLPASIKAFVASKVGRDLFATPVEAHELWVEKAFDVLIPSGRVSGVFDRVVLFSDRAELLDFKTGGETPAVLAERSRDQMALYRQCLAILTGLPESAIRTRLVCFEAGAVVEMD